jgi:tRNA(adenine34) deaminase
VQTVRTVSTAPPPGTFTKPAREIAEIMARPDVSPTGLGSAIRMIQYFINRGGRRLTPNRRMQLERAKQMLQRRLARDRLAATAAEPSGSRRTRAVLTR